jgi:hypothetical protein
MFDFDMTSDLEEFEKEITAIESEWFLGGELYLWNDAIARRCV